MPSILEDLFYQHDRGRKKDPVILQRIATNMGMLEKDFSDWQEMRLLDIIDDKNLLAWQWADDSFANGVRYGVQLMVEVFHHDGEK